MEFGDRVKQRRKELGMTLTALGGKAGIDRFTISKYERGITAPNLEAAELLADALNASLSWLIAGEEWHGEN